MSLLSQFAGGGIKTIQRGVILFGNTEGVKTATVTAVAPAKTELRFGGASSANGGADGGIRVDLTNATTVTATRLGTGANAAASWELTEYY